MTSPTVTDIATPVGADASAKGSQQDELPVSQVRQEMTKAERAGAISRASDLKGYFEAEYRLFWTLWQRDGGFDQKAAYDVAKANHAMAEHLLDSLKLQAEKA